MNYINEQTKSLSIHDMDAELVVASGNRTSPMGSATNLCGSRTNLVGAGARTSPVEHKSYTANKWMCSVFVYIQKTIVF